MFTNTRIAFIVELSVLEIILSKLNPKDEKYRNTPIP